MDPLIFQYPGITACISNADDRVSKTDREIRKENMDENSYWNIFHNGYAGMHGILINEMSYWKTFQNGYVGM